MQPASFTAEELLKTCRPSGVGRVNLIQMSYYGFDNRYMLDMIKLYPDRFVGTAIIDHEAPDPASRMADLATRGVRAFRIRPDYQGGKLGSVGPRPPRLPDARWLEPEGYAAMFAASEKQGLALSCLIDPSGFAEVDRMARRFPQSTVIIDHLGRIGVGGSVEAADVEALCALAVHPRMFVKVGAFYALGKKTPPYLDLAPMIRRVVQAFGAERCLWESDCPFQVVRDSYADSVALIRDRLDFLDADQKAWILHRTAERLLFRA
jgi:predicted TIM-barrel fold metal-dependent hydrolase